MDGSIVIFHGDCLDVLKTLPSASIDSVITDPPAGISFMGKEWDRSKGGRDNWVVWLAARLSECLRVAKPGAHALVWALPRTSHWTATAIEDAGWVIEDRVAHIFGTGFPKHKSKLKPAVEDWWLATKPGGEKWLGVDACRIEGVPPSVPQPNMKGTGVGRVYNNNLSKGRNGEMSQASGRWPTNLVLSHHPECKPNGTKKVKTGTTNSRDCTGTFNVGKQELKRNPWVDADGTETVEAFVCHPDCPVAMIDEQSGESKSQRGELLGWASNRHEGWKREAQKNYKHIVGGYDDSGGASRFFPGFLYCPKANRKDRGDGNTHPTVKAEPLMRWLCKLVTPPGGTVLDPFAGSGSTGFAAEAEGFQSILIEQNIEYVKIIKDRQAEIEAKTPLFG